MLKIHVNRCRAKAQQKMQLKEAKRIMPIEIDTSKFVLAMYDIRGKQDFIFRTNKLKEIVGSSWLIRDCFVDYLFPAAKKMSIAEQEVKWKI